MQGRIHSTHRGKFTPFYTTVIGGTVTKVTLKDAENNVEKYINTPIGPLYENWKELKAQVAKRQPEKEFEKLDMNYADSLGDVFDEEKRDVQKKEIDHFVSTQGKRRAKLEKKAKANLAKKNADAKKAAAAKAAKEEEDAKKAAAAKAAKEMAIQGAEEKPKTTAKSTKTAK